VIVAFAELGRLETALNLTFKLDSVERQIDVLAEIGKHDLKTAAASEVQKILHEAVSRIEPDFTTRQLILLFKGHG